MMIKTLIFFCYLVLISCSRKNAKISHHDAVMDGYNKLPIAESINRNFGAWSFITHWNIANGSDHGMKENEKDWQTIAYVYGRYELIYEQRVTLTENGGIISSINHDPKIYLKEYSRIYGDSVAPGNDFSDFQILIEIDDINTLIKSNWNFDSIGVKLKKEPLKNIEWIYSYWNRIMPTQQVTYNNSW